MRPLSASELLSVWERGQAQSLAQRALLLLAAACPDTPAGALARLSIGQRDAGLLALRKATFGPQLVSVTACPGCGERLETTFGVDDLLVGPAEEGAGEDAMLSLDVADWQLRFRLPNSLDLEAVAVLPDATAARRLLLERCLVAVRQGDREVSPGRLPAEAEAAVVGQMAQADPQADVHLQLSCPTCARQWEAPFDIASFFWSEIDAWARRILGEVHTLATAYGWREADILALSPWRRQIYLEMVRG